MANIYSAIYGDLNFWDGTIEWGFDATSDVHSPTAHADQSARDAQYTAAYTSAAAWEAGRDGASAGGNNEYGIIQTQWDSDDTSGFQISGWSSDAVILMAIGAARHSGTWDDGADSPHRLVAAAVGTVLKVRYSNTTIDGMQIYNSHTTDTNSHALSITIDNPTGVVFKNNVVKSFRSNCITINDSVSTVEIYNNVCYCAESQDAFSEGIFIDSVDIAGVYNNTVYNFNSGIDIDAVATSCTIKNNAVFGNGTDFADAVGVTTNKNASDDAFGTNPITLDSTGNYSDEFTDITTFDFSVTDSGSVLYDAGEADVFIDDDDIIGTARPQSSQWDIGAFELIVAAGAGQAFRLRAIEKYFMPIFDDITDKIKEIGHYIRGMIKGKKRVIGGQIARPLS